MASTFSLIGCGQYGTQNHSDALVSRIRKLMPVETKNQTDLLAGQQQRQQQRKSDEQAGGNHNTAQHQEQDIPTHFAFHNLDMDDPLLSEALSDLWHCIKQRRTNKYISTGTSSNTSRNPLFQQVMWADCEGDRTIERIMMPLQLDLCETAVLYRISMEDKVVLDSPSSSMTTTPTNTTTTTSSSSTQSSDPYPQTDLLKDLSRNTTLKELRIEHCAPISLSVATLLGMGLFFSGHLETLSIKSCLLDRDTIPILAKGLQQAVSLKHLTLFWSNLWDDQVDALLSALPQQQQPQQRSPQLQRQQYCQSHLTTPFSSCGLLQLDLTGNICRIKAIEAVSKLLVPPPDYQNQPKEGAKVGCLDRLCLREQCIEVEKLPIGPLIEALQYNSSLIHLDLSVNKLEDNDLKCLGEALIGNTTLHELDVRSNQITDHGVQEFARRALLPVTSDYSNKQGPRTKSQEKSRNNGMLGLRKLWLQDNPIGERGAMAIRNALAVNFQLEYVGFGEYFGSISDEIEYYTTLNWGGRRLLLLPSSIGCSIDNGVHDQNATSTVPSIVLWPLVLERANKYAAMDRVANIIYYLLRGGPTLFNR